MARAAKPREELPPREEWLAVGERLEMARNVLRMNQKEFLLGTGVSESHYSGVKRGQKGLSLEKTMGFVNTHGLSLDWILLGKLGMDVHMMRALQALTNVQRNRADDAEEPRPERRPQKQ
jgi:transcriptional regulator with XRE-family HTH domain